MSRTLCSKKLTENELDLLWYLMRECPILIRPGKQNPRRRFFCVQFQHNSTLQNRNVSVTCIQLLLIIHVLFAEHAELGGGLSGNFYKTFPQMYHTCRLKLQKFVTRNYHHYFHYHNYVEYPSQLALVPSLKSYTLAPFLTFTRTNHGSSSKRSRILLDL